MQWEAWAVGFGYLKPGFAERLEDAINRSERAKVVRMIEGQVNEEVSEWMKVDNKSIHYVGKWRRPPFAGAFDLWISCTFNSISGLENNNFALAVDNVT
jgi:hypothetical protein